MNGISKINRRCAFRKLDHIALWRKAKHFIRIHLELHGLKKIKMVMIGIKLRDQRVNPLKGIHGEWVFTAHAIPIRPMGRHAAFRNIMHLLGADLHFNALTVSAGNGGMNRPIPVGFWLANIIFKSTRHGPPALMDNSQHAITIGFTLGEDPKPINI